MNLLHRNTYIAIAFMLTLAGCGNGTEELEPEATDGAPTYEQLNPPATDESSMTPVTPDNQQDTVELPAPGQNSDHSVPEDAPASQKDGSVTLP